MWMEEISFLDERNRKIKTIIDGGGCSMSVTGENEERWLSLKPNEKIVAADVMTCEEQAVKIQFLTVDLGWIPLSEQKKDKKTFKEEKEKTKLKKHKKNKYKD